MRIDETEFCLEEKRRESDLKAASKAVIWMLPGMTLVLDGMISVVYQIFEDTGSKSMYLRCGCFPVSKAWAG